MSGKLKMDEIAARTGYSVSTVSRVLSGKSYTSDKAREAIVSCARQLGVLDDLASGRLLINGIAVFAPQRTFIAQGDTYYLEVTRGIAEAVAPHDVYVSYCGLDEQRADIKVFMEKAGHKNINAIIIIGIDDPTIHKLAQSLDKPCVLINSRDKEGLLDSVSPDHRAIGYSAANYLFEQGHRRILNVTSLRRETMYWRLEGIKEVYRQYQLPFDAQRDLLVTEGFSEEETERAFADWFASTPPSAWPEVVFCAGLPMSVGIYHVLQKRGVRVPQDISLMTTYVWELDAPMRNETTGIAIPCRALGIEAVHLLQTRLNRPNAPVFNLLLQGKVYDLGSVTHATRHAARAVLDSKPSTYSDGTIREE
ncbi:LacI family DNA-binding transcriptional regulator [Kluyvera georgiana]|uniref:LacI family DNA-binding transcriptional regulator n=1 Tax=Kluyvera georgiana TaxID=73098 RepID=UPI003F680DC3